MEKMNRHWWELNGLTKRGIAEAIKMSTTSANDGKFAINTTNNGKEAVVDIVPLDSVKHAADADIAVRKNGGSISIIIRPKDDPEKPAKS